jgi:hypothetical protein
MIPAALRRFVIRRAANVCEYCGLSQQGQEATFHIDHVIPRMAGGATDTENLALACVSCSLRKAARQTAVDPHSGNEVPLYNPRRDDWQAHSQWQGVTLVGTTPPFPDDPMKSFSSRPIAELVPKVVWGIHVRYDHGGERANFLTKMGWN